MVEFQEFLGIYLMIIRIRPGVDFDVVRAVAAADLF